MDLLVDYVCPRLQPEFPNNCLIFRAKIFPTVDAEAITLENFSSCSVQDERQCTMLKFGMRHYAVRRAIGYALRLRV